MQKKIEINTGREVHTQKIRGCHKGWKFAVALYCLLSCSRMMVPCCLNSRL